MLRKDAANATPAEESAGLGTSQALGVVDDPGPISNDGHIPRVGAGFIAVYTVTYFGFYLAMFMPALFSLAFKIQLLDPADKETILGVVVGVAALIMLPVGPIFGVLSDRSKLAWGRRRPFLLLGLGVFALAAVLTAIAPNVPLVLVGYAITQIAVAIVSAALNPSLAERVPPAQRGKLGALSGVAASVAGVCATLVGSYLTSNLLLLFLTPVVVFAVGVTLWLFVIPDEPAPERFQSISVATSLRSLFFDPRKHPDFTWVWVGKLFIGIGTAFFTTYQLYFLLDRLGFTAEEAGRRLAVVGGFALLATVGFTLVGGFLSDRLRRRKAFVYLAAVMIAIGITIAAFAHDFVTYMIGGVLLAAGQGAFNSVDLALASDVLPDRAAGGKWMSIYQISGTLATAIGPVLAPVLLAIGTGGANYTALFITGGLFAIGAAIGAVKVRGVK